MQEIQVKAGETLSIAFDRDTVLRILNGAPEPEPDPVNETLVGPGELQEAILDKAPNIVLKDGYYEPFYVITGTNIRAQNPGDAIISAAKPWNTGWTSHGGIYSKEWKTPLHQHPAHQVHTIDGKPSARGLMHRKAQQPHMLVLNGAPMQAVYDKSQLINNTFYLEGTAAKPVRIWAKFEGSPAELDIQACFWQKLIYTETDDVDGVTLDGLFLQYAANTGTQGALHLPPASDNWIVKNTTIENTNSEGVRIQGNNHKFTNVNSMSNGQAGFVSLGMHGCELTDCNAHVNVTKSGIDPLWHAGGAKFTKSTNNVIRNYKAVGNGGAGIWLDIYNKDNIIDGFELLSNMAFGVHIEHHTTDGVLSNGIIHGTHSFNTGVYDVGSGLQIQGAITGYEFSNIEITGNDDGAVRYKKRDSRGASGGNVFDNITYSNNGNGNRWAVIGDLSHLPDSYENMDMPDITNWP